MNHLTLALKNQMGPGEPRFFVWIACISPVSFSWFHGPRQCKMVTGEQVWFACVLPRFDRTDGAFRVKELKFGFARAIRACCGSALTLSDVSGVVVMAS